jgi:hypothetical protein
MEPTLTLQRASHFAHVTLAHVAREYPNKPDHVLNETGDLRSPRALHPVFYGSFDWHGCVLGYWLLSRLYRRFPTLPERARIREVIDAQFTRDNAAAEIAYLRQPLRATFERPYGWAWLLMLAAELARHASEEGARWSGILAPLTEEFVRRFHEFLGKASYPVRSGVHSSTAFALACAMEYAEVAGDGRLAATLRDKALAWYGEDTDCQCWEPGGEDFLSPALVEAECMRRVLPAAEFPRWFDRFLPRLGAAEPASLFQPAAVSDRSDGKIVHLDGLNLSRAWCWRCLAQAFPHDDDRRALFLGTAKIHLEASLSHIEDDYMGSHWLATYAALALDADEL